MKCILVAVLMMALANQAQADNLSRLEVELSHFADRPGFQARIEAVQKKTTTYAALIAQAESLSRTQSKTVHVVGQWHIRPKQDPDIFQLVTKSQIRIYVLLDSLSSQLVCNEGWSEDRDGMANLVRQIQFAPLDTPERRQSVREYWRVNGPLAYAAEHADIPIIGGEDDDLRHLQGAVIDSLESGEIPKNEKKNWEYFSLCLREFRSEIALAKTIIALDSFGLTRGVIVMGQAHAQDYTSLWLKYSLGGQYFSADSLLVSDQPTTIDDLELALTRFAGNQPFNCEREDITDQIPYLRRLLAAADSLSRREYYHVDFIGNKHWKSHQTEEEQMAMLRSQQRVATLLDSLQFDIIGSEGMIAGRIKATAIRDTISALLRKNNVAVSADVVEARVHQWLETEGAIHYLWNHPPAYVIGLEDQSLNDPMLRHFEYLAGTDGLVRSASSQNWLELGQAVRRTRTEIALALMIIELNNAGLHRGVLVMGQDHLSDYEQIIKRYPTVAWRFWATIRDQITP